MEKNVIIAFVIIGLVIILYPYYLRMVSPPQPMEAEPGAVEERRQNSALEEIKPETTTQLEDELVKSGIGRNVLAQADTSVEPVEISVDTELYRARFSTLGGEIKRWQLKSFEGIENEWVELLPENAVGALALTMNDEIGGIDLSKYVFSCEARDICLDETKQTGSIRMVLDLQDGRRIEKEFTFHQGRYSFDMSLVFEGFGKIVSTREYEVAWNPGLRSTEADIKEDMNKMSAYALMGSDVSRYDFGRKEVTFERKEDGTSRWIGIRTKYFFMSMIPGSEAAKGVRILGHKNNVTMGKESLDLKTFSVALRMPLESNTLTRHDFEVYIGPQDYDILRSYGVSLEKSMDLGWPIIRPVSRVILAFFVLTHRFIPNYGLVIILFTLLLKVIFYPLTHKQLESMKKMQQLQPQLAALKEKYKKDPQRLNRETMALYKKGGANPLGGCFPLLLQMPVFFALFSVFRTTIEFRRAEFVWWIKDLSVKDPYLVLPIIMAVTMFIQQKMTMKDPKQAAMVYMMPAIMFFFFMNFASGLVLYWTVFNILSILQQVIIDRRERTAVAK